MQHIISTHSQIIEHKYQFIKNNNEIGEKNRKNDLNRAFNNFNWNLFDFIRDLFANGVESGPFNDAKSFSVTKKEIVVGESRAGRREQFLLHIWMLPRLISSWLRDSDSERAFDWFMRFMLYFEHL